MYKINLTLTDILYLSLFLLLLYIFHRAYYWLYSFPRSFVEYYKAQGLKGPTFKFLVGDFPAAQKASVEGNNISFSVAESAQYDHVYPICMGPMPVLNMNDPEYLKYIFTSKASCYAKSDHETKYMLSILLLNGLLMSEGEHWKRQRNLMSPAFHFQNLKEMVPMMAGAARAATSRWIKAINEKLKEGNAGAPTVSAKAAKILGTSPSSSSSSSSSSGDAYIELEMVHEIAGITLDTVCTAAFGSDFHDSPEKQALFINTQKEVLRLQAWRTINLIGYIPYIKRLPFRSLRDMRKGCAIIHNLIRDIVQKRVRGESQAVGGRADLLDLMLSAEAPGGERMSKEEILEEAINIIGAGAETTSTLMAWLMWKITTEKGVWERMRDEVDTVVGAATPSADQLRDLKYMEAVIYEALRMYPPAHMIMKLAIREHELRPGLVIKEGTYVSINAHVVHRLEKYWPEPECFRPERFLNFADGEEANGTTPASPSSSFASSSPSSSSSSSSAPVKQHPFAFLGFSAGPRKCLGKNFAVMEMKVILTAFVQQFDMEWVEGQQMIPDTITSQPRYGVKMRIRKRKAPRKEGGGNGEKTGGKVLRPVGMI